LTGTRAVASVAGPRDGRGEEIMSQGTMVWKKAEQDPIDDWFQGKLQP
jgi:hypothetical protein